jgi:nucleoid-associated protein YgaU
MISKFSRYINGDFGQVIGKTGVFNTHVYRNFSVDPRIEYIWYTFKAGDRVDTLASQYLGDSRAWYRIMDINPEVLDPFSLKPGDYIRIPQ